MKKAGHNRMLKKEHMVEREEEPQESEDGDLETLDDVRVRRPDLVHNYPCKYCQSETVVIKTFPAVPIDTQWPIKYVKQRRRECKSCRRKFLTQETFIAET